MFSTFRQNFKASKKEEKKKLDLKNIAGNIRVCLNMALPVAATLSCNIKLKIRDYFQ